MDFTARSWKVPRLFYAIKDWELDIRFKEVFAFADDPASSNPILIVFNLSSASPFALSLFKYSHQHNFLTKLFILRLFLLQAVGRILIRGIQSARKVEHD